MIIFKTIAYFRERLSVLKAYKRGVYAGVDDEIKREFSNRPIEQIRMNGDMILLEGEVVVIKLRLPDKKHRLAKKDGYRLIYLVSKQTPLVAFLDIYPKNGPMQQIDEDEKTIKRLLNDFNSEGEAGVLGDYSL